tara:strand:- start:981 stop:1286 length:306 start_codon:yes stop_codon:yes gene_type:complete
MRIVSSIDIATVRPKPRDAVATETERAVPATSRALATQRDVMFFNAQPVMLGRQNASPAFLAQQIGQLWPCGTSPVAATEAYRTAALPMVETAPSLLRARA